MKKSSLLNALLILSILGILTSAYLVKIHYSAGPSTFCNFSANINCDIVNRGIYSLFPPDYYGVPVSLLGLLTFIGIFILLLIYKFKATVRKSLAAALFYLFLISFLFALYLLYIEAFILQAYCIFCILLDLIIVASLILSYQLRKSQPEQPWELHG